jgi:outer membrane lipase/esterase
MMSFCARTVAFAKAWLFSFILIIGLLASGLASADGRPFARIVVFGDSLSDSGNLFALRGPFDLDAPGEARNNWGMDDDLEKLTLVPDQAYVSGRLSNGPTWVELLGTVLGGARNVKPAFGSTDRHALNFAVAGAAASNFGSLPAGFNLSGQVGAFIARADDIRTTSRTLYVIAIGGNDIRAAAAAPAQAEAIFEAALASIEANITALNNNGAKKILIWNAPDLGRTPATLRTGAFQCALAGQPDRECIKNIALGVSALSANYNDRLDRLLDGLEPSLGIEFIRFDAFGLLKELQENKSRYGLENVVQPCIQLGPPPGPGSMCAEPDRYLFWDGIHPTRATHRIIALLNGKALVQALLD